MTFGPESVTLKDGRAIVLRHMRGEDGSRYPSFMSQVAEESTHTLQYVGQPFPSEEALRTRCQDFERDPVSLSLGAFSGDRLVGLIGLMPERPGHPWVRHAAHFGMMILKEFWGLGLGTAMLTALDTHCRRAGVRRVEAMVRTTNHRGLALYLKCGYQVEGLRRQAAFINGQYEDEYFIAKLLE